MKKKTRSKFNDRDREHNLNRWHEGNLYYDSIDKLLSGLVLFN